MRTLKVSLAVRAAAELELRRRRREAAWTSPPLWEPYPDSPQERAVASVADVVGYGGAAGGGKSDTILGTAATRHRRSVIFRREAVQLKGLIDRSHELFDGHGWFNGHDLIWRDLPGDRKIEFGHVQRPGDERKHQGRPKDFIGFDELTHFQEKQFWTIIGWLRTAHDGQRCRVMAGFNPPLNASERWVIDLFAPWLDRKHPNPAMPGELRWYVRVDGDRVECEDGTPFEHEGETITPLSWTFFPARLADNPVYAATGYGAQLQSLPEPLRSQLLYGDFDAAMEDDPWQIIPTRWIVDAMERWKAFGGIKAWPAGHSPTVIGHDVAWGGPDKTVNALRYGDWFAPLDKHKGIDTPDGISAARTVIRHVSGIAKVHMDAASKGAASYERLRDDFEMGKNVVPIDFGGASEYRDRSGLFKMFNLRAEMWWRMRDALDPENGATLMLPDDPELLSDLAAPRFEVRPGIYKVEDKAAIKKRIGRSPDCGDACCMAMLPTTGIHGHDTMLQTGKNPIANHRGTKAKRGR